MHLFTLLNFKRELSPSGSVKLRIEKNKSNYKRVKDFSQLLKLVQSVDF